MILSDIVTLAKAGFTFSDIKELMKEPEQKPEQKPEEKPEQKPEEKPEQKPGPDPDYKALYEQAKNDLEKAQKANINKDISDQKKDEDAEAELSKLFSEFL